MSEVIRVAPRLDKCPTKTGHALAVESHHLARKQSQAFNAAVFLTRFESELHPQTDSKDIASRGESGAKRLGGAGLVQVRHRTARRTHAGQDHIGRLSYLVGF